MPEQQYQLFDVRDSEPVIEPVQRMRDGVREILRGQILLQVENILPDRLHLAVLGLSDSPDEQMHFAAIVGKPRADLLRDENPGPVGDFEAAFDPVVIRERDEIHPAFAQRIVKRARLRVAVRQACAAEKPLGGAVTEFGVEVEISVQVT